MCGFETLRSDTACRILRDSDESRPSVFSKDDVKIILTNVSSYWTRLAFSSRRKNEDLVKVTLSLSNTNYPIFKTFKVKFLISKSGNPTNYILRDRSSRASFQSLDLDL